MDPSFTDIIAALRAIEARFLVVGGVAVVLHGVLRVTADLDLVVHMVPDNLHPILRALERLGFQPRLPVSVADFANPAIRRRWITERNMTVFTLWHPRNHRIVDLFVEEPFEFEAVWGRRVELPIGDVWVPIVSIDDLVAMKQAAGRPKDLTDIAALRSLREVPDG